MAALAKVKGFRALFWARWKGAFPTILFYLVQFLLVMWLFGSEYAMVVSGSTTLFQIRRREPNRLEDFLSMFLMSLVLCLLAFAAGLNVWLCALLNFGVLFVLVIWKCSQFAPKGHLGYAMTFVFLELRPISLEQLRRIPIQVGVAAGVHKKQSIMAAIRGGYLNTLVVDEKSQFGGDIKVSSRYWPEIYAMDLDSRDVKYVSAIEENAYPGVRMHRTLVYADIPFLQCPLIMDVLKADSRQEHRYDYPVHYNGQMISLTVPYEKALTEMRPLGTADGYRHLWVEARAAGGDGKTTYTWMTGDRMYSLSVNTTPSTELYLARIGADDPDFNLRPDPVYIVRENGVRSRTFVSCLETHGKYDLQVEQSANLVHSCESVATLLDTAEYTVAEF